MEFAPETLQHSDAQSLEARERIALAKHRIRAVLDREIVSNQRTLEQKISDQGPTGQRVDPHLLGLAIKDLKLQKRIIPHTHPKSKTKWYSNTLTTLDDVEKKLSVISPLYSKVTGSAFSNLVGDALEIITFKCLISAYDTRPRFLFHGSFDLTSPKDKHGRYKKIQPPKHVGTHQTIKEADFIQYGYDEGGLCIECKNYREWLYPNSTLIKELIIKSYELNLIPVMIHRRIHYTTKTNLLKPSGIIAHESYYQYYPADQTSLADDIRNPRLLGFTDVKATEIPDNRTERFIIKILPTLVPYMAPLWHLNRDSLYEYAKGEIHLAQLYNKINSRASGNWHEP